MRKYIVAIALLMLGMSAHAQSWITNLDEIEMLGKWVVTEIGGDFPEFQNNYRWEYPTSIVFNNRNSTFVFFKDFNDNETAERYVGYWIGGSATGKYTLHLLSNKPYNDDSSGMSLVNFRIQHFDGGVMVLRTYDGGGRIQLEKENSAGIRSTRSDATDGKAYHIDGTPAAESDKGIIIQDGKKSVQK